VSGRVAKKLRRMAREEMVGTDDRELVIFTDKKGNERLINEPLTKRSMYLALQREYKKSRRKGTK
jgi:hypothetical protein